MSTIKRIRLILTDPSTNASLSPSGSGSGSGSTTTPAPVSMSSSADGMITGNADTSTELVRLLQAGVILTGPLAATTAATSATSTGTKVIPAGAPGVSMPSSVLTSSANSVMEALAGLCRPGGNISSGVGTSAGATTHDLTSPAALSAPSTETAAGTGSVTIPKKRSKKGKERAVAPNDQNQDQGAGLAVIKAKRRRKATGHGAGGSAPGSSEGGVSLMSACPKKRGRPRKDPNAATTPRRNAKGKGRSKDSTDASIDAVSTEALSDPTTKKDAKDGGDSEFETDDDMAEIISSIISSRIPQTQKRKVEVLEEPDCQDEPGEQEEGTEFGSGSGDGEESDHEGDVGHERIATQELSETSSSDVDAGHFGAVRSREYTCSIFPTEVLQQILLCLPLSKITRHSRISKAWLDAARVLPVWKEACKKAKLGDPRKKYKTHMALVCANSYWICERCMSFSKGREHYADLPLPVEDKDDDHLVWMLCLACRQEYFERHPEPLKEDRIYRDEFAFVVQTKQLAPHAIFINYALRGENLRGVPSTGREDTRNQLFDRGAVQRRALEVHGGWIGIDACATNPGRKRAAVCNERAKECRLYKKKPLTKKRPPVPEEKREERREALEQRREERENARHENRRQKLLWDRVTRLSKRHKWHTTSNWRKNRYY
ncbi:hypothetical protein K457DRAFT_140232 [Linnemannia elongata AG-77]|uniref:F-box domain-containing protein n=1 Tax=Linnemannia elongata AG-77 TaxID=1314771 RepID=A0A197JMW3_9FUNG|nr:hypothetical protein K457DRAFT_140232 [Linnemannia elongata AG-77]